MIGFSGFMRRPYWVVLFVAAMSFVPLAADAADKKAEQAAAMNEMVSDMQLRVQKLEQLVSQLTGDLEEQRFKNSQLTRQLQTLQDDLSSRVMGLEQGAGGRPAAAVPAPAPAAAPTPTPPPQKLIDTPASGSQTYDPNAPLSAPVSKQPDMTPRAPAAAPSAGTPAALPTTDAGGFVIRTDAAGKPLPPDPNAPAAPPPQAAAPVAPPKITAPPAPGAVAGGGVTGGEAVAVALPAGTPKQQYEFATSFLVRQDFARAEGALRAFLKTHPNDPLAANAQYWLGESLYARGDYQQAAVEFMEGYQKYRKSPKGPDNLLKLGLSLSNMRQTSGACTAFGSIAKEYPNADDKIRKEAQAERTKLKCPAA